MQFVVALMEVHFKNGYFLISFFPSYFVFDFMEMVYKNVGFNWVILYCSERCGISVPIALADMHECDQSKNNVKKLKGQPQGGNVKRQNIQDQPRSAFRFFVYIYIYRYSILRYFIYWL